jgi:hypothetical protein
VGWCQGSQLPQFRQRKPTRNLCAPDTLNPTSPRPQSPLAVDIVCYLNGVHRKRKDEGGDASPSAAVGQCSTGIRRRTEGKCVFYEIVSYEKHSSDQELILGSQAFIRNGQEAIRDDIEAIRDDMEDMKWALIRQSEGLERKLATNTVTRTDLDNHQPEVVPQSESHESEVVLQPEGQHSEVIAQLVARVAKLEGKVGKIEPQLESGSNNITENSAGPSARHKYQARPNETLPPRNSSLQLLPTTLRTGTKRPDPGCQEVRKTKRCRELAAMHPETPRLFVKSSDGTDIPATEANVPREILEDARQIAKDHGAMAYGQSGRCAHSAATQTSSKVDKWSRIGGKERGCQACTNVGRVCLLTIGSTLRIYITRPRRRQPGWTDGCHVFEKKEGR